MNLRNKWAVHIVRTLLGILMLGMGVLGLYYVVTGNVPEIAGSTRTIQMAETGLAVSGLMVGAKVVEIIVGIMLLANFRAPLANLLLAPITVAIMIYDLVLWTHMPAALIPAVFAFLANIYLGYVYWDKYAGLFAK